MSNEVRRSTPEEMALAVGSLFDQLKEAGVTFRYGGGEIRLSYADTDDQRGFALGVLVPDTRMRFRHVRNGRDYVFVDEGKLKLNGKWHPVVIYESADDGAVYVRPIDNFHKRFRPLVVGEPADG